MTFESRCEAGGATVYAVLTGAPDMGWYFQLGVASENGRIPVANGDFGDLGQLDDWSEEVGVAFSPEMREALHDVCARAMEAVSIDA